MLTTASQIELREFLATDPLLAFDYDGTLCPIVGYSEQAKLSKKARNLLQEACVRSVCVLITGRSRTDVLEKVQGVPFAQVVGSHGADWVTPRPSTEKFRKRVQKWHDQVMPVLKTLQGVEIEDKGLSLSIHYRHARRRELAIERIEQAMAGLRGLRVIGGKEVFNLLPRESSGKGKALLELKKLLNKKTAVYFGDDLTDEEVFDLTPRERIFKVRIGQSRSSQADYFLPKQKDIESILALLSGRRHAEEAA